MKPEDNFKMYNEIKSMYKLREEYADDIKNGILSDPNFINKIKVIDYYKFITGWIRGGKDMRVLDRVLIEYPHGKSFFGIGGGELTVWEIESLEKAGFLFTPNAEYLNIRKAGELRGLGT